jgi:nicotinamide riboside kinase
VPDAVRVYGDDAVRARFARVSRTMLEQAGVPWAAVGGDWDARFARAVALVEALDSSQGFDSGQESE